MLTIGEKMTVKIISDEDNTNCDYVVLQANNAPCPPSKMDSVPIQKENNIFVFVPLKTSSVVCQVDYEQRKCLENCYYNCIIFAFKTGKSSIQFPELGVNFLYWDSIQSASAARVAIERSFEEVCDDFLIVFEIDKSHIDIWDEVMIF